MASPLVPGAVGSKSDDMEECEVCGKKFNDLYLVEIEGAQMMACRNCSQGKEILRSFSDAKAEPVVVRTQKRDAVEVVENYGKIIKHARESLGLPTKVVAERINEKESAIIRVEEEKGLPDDRLAKKLEHFLGIRLLVSQEAEKKSYSNAKQSEVTIGDSIIIKDKRKGN